MPVDAQLFLSKILPLIVLPEGLLAIALLGILVSVWRRAWRLTVAMALLAFAIFWCSAMPIMATWLMATLEQQHPTNEVRGDVAIVLGGAVSNPTPPRTVPELGEAADRVWMAAHLYRTSKVNRILVVGGNLPWSHHPRPEAELIQSLLVDLGVPATAIDIGGTSRNTFENAIEAKALLPPTATAVLVTSAWHMPRALAVFTKAGIPVVAAPCDFRASDPPSGTLLDWLPQAQAFAMTSAALREWMGIYVYWWRGWL